MFARFLCVSIKFVTISDYLLELNISSHGQYHDEYFCTDLFKFIFGSECYRYRLFVDHECLFAINQFIWVVLDTDTYIKSLKSCEVQMLENVLDIDIKSKMYPGINGQRFDIFDLMNIIKQSLSPKNTSSNQSKHPERDIPHELKVARLTAIRHDDHIHAISNHPVAQTNSSTIANFVDKDQSWWTTINNVLCIQICGLKK